MKRNIIVFSKAQVSSLTATAVDFTLTFICLKWLNIYYIISTALGAISGGMTNCIINYKWTFHAKGIAHSKVAHRYTLVWMGSLLLNVAGVYFLKNFFQEHTSLWIEAPSLCVMLAKTITAVFVAVFWNYLLQRYYVFNLKNKKGNGK
ncbi:MAG: GtrA family protein [Bacteroidaceae bacterium]|nr:GtrA family protein [Bacteroidaceae bacterium]